MATATVDRPVAEVAATKKQPIPIKVGWFGSQGAGKTTSAALAALALSVEIYNRAPVWVTDTEPGWQFLRPLFEIEGVELVQRTVPTFLAMKKDLRDAERAGACVYAVDSLTILWQELMQSFKAKNNGQIPINVWGDIKALWGSYTTSFLNSSMCCFALGRLGNTMEDQLDDQGKTKLVKTGTTFKAGGGESFGYEPHLLLEMSLERKAKRKAGVQHEGEGRMIHRVDVLKDRTWALNGQVLRWTDKSGYTKGGYKQVWQSLKPHFDRVQGTMAMVTLGSGTSEALIDDNGNSEFYRNRQRRDVLVAELHAAMELLWGGQGKEEKQTRLRVFEHVFGFRSKEAADAAKLEVIERGVRILQAFEQRIKEGKTTMPSSMEGVLSQLDIVIAAHDAGEYDNDDLPF